MLDNADHRALPLGRFFEEWEAGQVFSTSPRRIDAATVVEFVQLTGDDNPLHQGFDQPLVPGLLTVAVATGLVSTLGLFAGTTVALLRQECDFLRPLRAPCTVRVDLEVTRLRPWKDDSAGVVETRREVVDEQGIVVARCTHQTLVRRRGAMSEKEHQS